MVASGIFILGGINGGNAVVTWRASDSPTGTRLLPAMENTELGG